MLRSASSMLKPIVIDTIPKRFRGRKILTWPVDYLPFKWSYPKKLNLLEESGDKTKSLPDFSRDRPVGIFAELPELSNAPEAIKRVFSVDLATKLNINRNCMEDFLNLVRRHPYDNDSLEFKIAYRTFKIRLYNEVYAKPHKKNKRLKDAFNRTVQKRNKYLKELGRQDSQRYQFVKDVLQIEHNFFPLGEGHKQITRKGELRRLAQEWTDKIKADKMEAYHGELKELQKSFEIEKKETEEWIAKEIEELKLTEAELKELDFKGILQ